MSSGHDCFSRQYDGAIATHYDVLGVTPDAPPELIRAAYRDRARRHHPDRTPTGEGDAMSQVNEAYRVLSDPRRRMTYDRSIGRRTSAGASTGAVCVIVLGVGAGSLSLSLGSLCRRLRRI